MADISQITLPDGNNYNLKDTLARSGSVHVVLGTQTAATSAWTGNIDVDALYDGLTILYYLPYASGSAKVTINLTLKDGETTTGPIKAYITGVADFTTAYAAGSAILFTYWDAGSISVSGTPTDIPSWRRADYYISNTNTIGEYAGSCIAGPFGMARYSLIMKVDETHWESLVSTSGTGTNKVKNTNGFLLNAPILYQNAATYEADGAAGQSGCWVSASFDTRYSTNGGQFSAAGKPFYLVGSITNGKFYLASTWWADSLPVNGSTDVYIYIGNMYSKYQATLLPNHPIYKYVTGVGWTQLFNGHSILRDVPADAVFTDTTYSVATSSTDGLMSSTDKSSLDTVVTNLDGHTVATDVPANAVFTDTTYSVATSSTDGLMSSTDKTSLDTVVTNLDGHTVGIDVPANAVFTDTTSLTIMSYGSSTWNDFITAYRSNALVYCRASSNSNPATGSQTRLAFMAYVNDAANPTNVEFQYYRSVNAYSASQQGDQVYVYKLTSAGTWTVTVREAYSKVVAGTGLSSSYNANARTLTLSANISNATTSSDGLMSSTDKTKLNNIAATYDSSSETISFTL